jgi:FSR family fosmidomycin resistance protein-like MFS transporter
MLAAGHGCVDLCQGAVPALLPFLIAERGLSLTAAAALITASTIGSSLVQPLFGLWADRLGSPVLLPAGVAVGSIGIGAAGLMESYALLVAVLVLGGLGVAAFHPEGRAYAGLVSGTHRSRGMSYFAVGGNAGFALGPALVTPLVATLGLRRHAAAALPGLAVSVLLLTRLGHLRRLADRAGPSAGPPRATRPCRPTPGGRSRASWPPRSRAPPRSSPSRRSCPCTSSTASARAPPRPGSRSPRCSSPGRSERWPAAGGRTASAAGDCSSAPWCRSSRC